MNVAGEKLILAKCKDKSHAHNAPLALQSAEKLTKRVKATCLGTEHDLEPVERKKRGRKA
jgi:hypothetical protein